MIERFNIRTFGSFSFFQTIDYMINDSDGSLIFSKGHKYRFKERNYYIVNYIMKIHLTSLKAYYDALGMFLEIKYKPPIYLNDNLIIIATSHLKDYDNIFINYTNIKEIKDLGNIRKLIFKSGTTLETKLTLKYFIKIDMRLTVIKNHLKNIK
ncbi:MAG TPA: hypothetical protein GX742_01560 [Acholeplasmataceae bacterium]|nr:hypothetical protein [Acholeplasmataceae bacterium]